MRGRRRVLKDSCWWLRCRKSSDAEARRENDFAFHPPLEGEGRRAALAARRGGGGWPSRNSQRAARFHPHRPLFVWRPPPSRGSVAEPRLADARRKFFVCCMSAWTTGSSPAVTRRGMRRENDFLRSSLPGLTRQSMRTRRQSVIAVMLSCAALQHGPPGQARW